MPLQLARIHSMNKGTNKTTPGSVGRVATGKKTASAKNSLSASQDGSALQSTAYIRARSPEQKLERMDAIMAAADALFQAHPYHQITMGAIAEELGWSRSNLYKYAATQEEIFLSLHSQKNRAWAEALKDTLNDAPLPPQEFARIWAETTEAHAGFLRYQEMLVSIIESNVTLERLTRFKRDLANTIDPIAGILARQCSANAEDAIALYFRLLYQAPALWNHFHCTEAAKQAMKAANFPKAKGTFAQAYTDFVLLCISE